MTSRPLPGVVDVATRCTVPLNPPMHCHSWGIGPKVKNVNAPELRASDEDREQVVHALERHTAAGRLSLDEHADRVERTLAARTCGELAAILSDLPSEPAEPTPATTAGDHQLAIAFLIACVALALVGALVLLFR